MGKGAKSKKTRRNNALKRKIMQPCNPQALTSTLKLNSIVTQSSLKKLNHINEMQKKGFDMLRKTPNRPEFVVLTPSRAPTQECVQISERPRRGLPPEEGGSDRRSEVD